MIVSLCQFSPRAWGWSDHIIQRAVGRLVLPTCVGMVRDLVRSAFRTLSSPHVRGDGPRPPALEDPAHPFSPRAWGWSVIEPDRLEEPGVLPTCVGMVRDVSEPGSTRPRSPHVRGDGPIPLPAPRAYGLFSPRAWGWSVPGPGVQNCRTVLPTCVGMVRCDQPKSVGSSSSPHVRGDGPFALRVCPLLDPFSPRAWGWSEESPCQAQLSSVLPTCVGMVRPSQLWPVC